MLFTSAVIFTLMMFAITPMMIAIAANSCRSACVGLVQKYGPNTDAAEIAIVAVPISQPASSVQPQNQPYCGLTILEIHEYAYPVTGTLATR